MRANPVQLRQVLELEREDRFRRCLWDGEPPVGKDGLDDLEDGIATLDDPRQRGKALTVTYSIIAV